MEFNFIIDIFFKVSAIVLSGIFVLFSVVVSKQVKIMSKTLEDKFNWIMLFISSLQVMIGIILLIFSIFLL